jgi:hypothetical protein
MANVVAHLRRDYSRDVNLAAWNDKVAALSNVELEAAASTYLTESLSTLEASTFDDLMQRIVLLSVYLQRIPGADAERVQTALRRANHERQRRQPHRMLGGVVPPHAEEVTTASIASEQSTKGLTRMRKLELLDYYIVDGQKLARGNAPERQLSGDWSDKRPALGRWRDDVVQTLKMVDAADWVPVVTAVGRVGHPKPRRRARRRTPSHKVG